MQRTKGTLAAALVTGLALGVSAETLGDVTLTNRLSSVDFNVLAEAGTDVDQFIAGPETTSLVDPFVQSLNYDFRGSFRRADGSHGVRAAAFDAVIRRFIHHHRDPPPDR